MVGDVAIAGRNSQFEIRYDLPERVIPAEHLAGADADRARRRQGAGPPGRPLARRRHAARPGRLLPPALGPRPEPDRSRAGRGRARRGGRADPGDGRGGPATGVPPSRRAAPAPGRRARPAQPVRPGGLGAGAHRGAVRLPLPDRDLHAGRRSASTATTCCRSSSATGSWAGSTSRPTARPGCCWCRAAYAEPGAPARDRRGARRRAASGSPAGSASTRSSSSRGATWPRAVDRGGRALTTGACGAPPRIGPVPAAG